MNQQQATNRSVLLRPPDPENAAAIYQLIANCKPLDINSEYLYLLLCTHYRDTCVAAFLEDKIAGAATGYIVPERKDTLFIWQIAVSERVRNAGLAKRMIQHLLNRRSSKEVAYIEATVSPSNQASLNLFKSFAQELKAEFKQTPYFGKELFRDKDHEEEHLVRVGPFKR